MLSGNRFSDLLRDLRQIERVATRADESMERQGGLILDAFLRHTSFDSGAVYLRGAAGSEFQLAAARGSAPSDERPELTLPSGIVDLTRVGREDAQPSSAGFFDPDARMLVPLRHGKDDVGLLALGSAENGSAEVDVDMLEAASNYLGMLLAHQRLASELREGDFQLKYRLWELESLYDIGLSIASTLNLDELTDEILIRTLSLLNARRAAFYLREGDAFQLKKSFGDVRSEVLDADLSDAFSWESLKEGTPIQFEDAAACIFPDCSSFVALPIRTGEQVIGLLAAGDRELRDGGIGPFEESDIQLLTRFANQVAIALENARLHREALEKQALERELELAVTIQRDILPRSVPAVPGFEIAAFSRPARQLGGDYHAFFQHEDGLSFCVADVSGKSVPAALLVSAFHAALQLLFDEGRDLGEIATELNRHIHRWSSDSKFITLIIATLDRERGMLRYVNAGHNPAYLVTATSIDHVRSNGLPVGMLPQTIYATQSRKLSPGDALILYSDGITEAENREGEEFGNERLREVIATHPGGVAGIRDAIVRAVDAFAGEVPQYDDQTVVAVRMLEIRG
ncbi:MAG: SpoIIE family protein phosphatase [Thermoanaerobaculia bacterium]